MIINNKDAAARLDSPLNLINRLRDSKKNNAMSLFGIGKKSETKPTLDSKPSFNPFEKPQPPQQNTTTALIPVETKPTESVDNILDDHEAKIKLGLAHDQAIELLNRATNMLASKLDDVKADKLPAVISAASKTVESIRRERNEAAKNAKDREVHFHFYTPQQKKVSDYEVIEVAAQ